MWKFKGIVLNETLDKIIARIDERDYKRWTTTNGEAMVGYFIGKKEFVAVRKNLCKWSIYHIQGSA